MSEEIDYRYAYRLRQGPATHVRASFNDLPFYREPSHSFADTTARADHLLVPGENTMTIEVWPGPKAPEAPVLLGPVGLALHANDGSNDDERFIARIRWPDVAVDRKDGKPTDDLPFAFTLRFQMPDDHLAPYHLTAFPGEARPEAIPEDGTPDLREAVRRLHEALLKQQPRLFAEELRFSFEEERRYYPSDGNLSIGAVLPDIEARFSKKMRVEPLPQELLRFESRAGGRVALATRRDGLPVIWAEGIDEQGHMNFDPLFVKKDGTWILYR